MVYAIGQKGAELLTTESGRRPNTDWSEKNRQLGASYLEHALMVSRFQAALRFALQETGSASLERWLPDGMVRDSVAVEHEASRERIPIAPDAFFTLRLVAFEDSDGFEKHETPLGWAHKWAQSEVFN